ncbi:MAG: stage V sporulation protein AA [Hungatella sp.]
MNKILYLNVAQITAVKKKEVYLSDVANLYCEDLGVQNRCKAIKVKSIKPNSNRRYVESVLDVIEKISRMDSSIQVSNIGEVDYIIDYQKPKPPAYLWQWSKTIAVSIVSFCGAAFAIMTFNNDVNVGEVFGEIYQMVMGEASDGFTVLEVTYSVGLALGIVVFFNHFASWKINTDPTPIEVEMRLYEENVSKTLIQNAGRKESGIDVT